MDARAKLVRDILHTADQYLVPFFQRHHAWKEKHWERLHNDVLALQEDDACTQHFLGPLVCTPSMHVPAEVTPYQLIDGQQRLCTLIVILAAFQDLARVQGLKSKLTNLPLAPLQGAGQTLAAKSMIIFRARLSVLLLFSNPVFIIPMR